jgi:mycothiol synthase
MYRAAMAAAQPLVGEETDATGRVLLVDATGHRSDVVAATLRSHLGEHGSVWVDEPPDDLDAAVAPLGLQRAREILRLERPLPLPEAWTAGIATRDFVPGRDEAAWVRVNNAAFASHREQGGWTVDRLRELESEPWFDPAGFRLHERDGRLAAFCWTKVHTESSPPAGEIFVIAVDPAFHGEGLGRALTVAGLEHLAGRGLTHALLYVDADNTPARAMYAALGFTEAARRRLYLP